VLNRLKKLNHHLLPFAEQARDVSDQVSISYVNDGLKLTKINYDTTSNEIRSFLDNRYNETNRLIVPKLLPNTDNPTLLVSLGNTRTLTNVQHRNIMLRILNGDIFSMERLKRFRMVETDTCERCNMVETSTHLLLECQESKKIWKHVTTILKSVGINFEANLPNILNLGNHISNKAVVTIVADINSFNLNKNRPVNIQETIIRQRIISIIKNERSHANNNKSNRKFYRVWKKLLPLAD
jgi:hypothetical protein